MGKMLRPEALKIFISQYILFFVPVLILVIAASYFLYKNNTESELAVLKTDEIGMLKLKEEVILREMEMVESDLQVLTTVDEMAEYFGNPSKDNLNKVKKEYLAFAEKKNMYDQIRLIDPSGNEIVRIDYQASGKVIIDDFHLQNKVDRYYFTETRGLGPGEIYISHLDLNVENGLVEVPYFPVLRFGIPYFFKGELKCILVLNFNARRFLEYIAESYQGIAGEKMLLNSNGYWLLSGNEEEEWGFMFEDKKDVVFSNKYPEIWKMLKEKDFGQIESDEGIFTYRKIHYTRYRGKYATLQDNPAVERNWILVSLLSKPLIEDFLSPLLLQSIFIGAVFLVVLVVAIFFVALLRVKNISAQREIAAQVTYLTERNKVKNKFFAIFSHDLKNSLGALRNYSLILKEDYDEMDDKERREFVDSIEDVSNGTMNLLLTLLEWANTNLKVGKDGRKMVHLSPIVNVNIELLKKEANAKNIKLESNINYDLEAFVDPGATDAVVRNFMVNAIKFTPEGGAVKIYAGTCKEDDRLFLTVEDNGVGMSEEQIARVLNPNEKYTTKGTKDETGTGIGLKMCKELIEKYNGVFRIESEPGKGSKFCFSCERKEKVS